MQLKSALLLISCFALNACGDSQYAAYLVSGPQHSLTLTRDQQFIGSAWVTELVVARHPDCQRRYPLIGAADDDIKMTVYRTEPGVFILQSGKRWYVTETASCRFEQFKIPPPEPGKLVGHFQLKDGKLAYQDLEAK